MVFLKKRLYAKDHYTVGKACIVFHHLMNKGGSRFLSSLSKHRELFDPVSRFRDDSTPEGQGGSSLARSHANYLGAKLETYKRLEQLYELNPKKVGEASMKQQLQILPELQNQLDCLLPVKLKTGLVRTQVARVNLGVMLRDCMKLYTALNMGMTGLVEEYFNLEYKQARAVYETYYRFCKETDVVIELFDLSRNLLQDLPKYTAHPPALRSAMRDYQAGLKDGTVKAGTNLYEKAKKEGNTGEEKKSNGKSKSRPRTDISSSDDDDDRDRHVGGNTRQSVAEDPDKDLIPDLLFNAMQKQETAVPISASMANTAMFVSSPNLNQQMPQNGFGTINMNNQMSPQQQMQQGQQVQQMQPVPQPQGQQQQVNPFAATSPQQMQQQQMLQMQQMQQMQLQQQQQQQMLLLQQQQQAQAQAQGGGNVNPFGQAQNPFSASQQVQSSNPYLMAATSTSTNTAASSPPTAQGNMLFDNNPQQQQQQQQLQQPQQQQQQNSAQFSPAPQAANPRRTSRARTQAQPQQQQQQNNMFDLGDGMGAVNLNASPTNNANPFGQPRQMQPQQQQMQQQQQQPQASYNQKQQMIMQYSTQVAPQGNPNAPVENPFAPKPTNSDPFASLF